ncbi:hypothetical protein LR48_Vigan05g103700 [Vigna angularis]|uniref:Uncharacterized protein n=1 Tax=Phaseolus angularis TaxID=3914 RepID=A0A0L9UKZ6_PHAAN|nr:hypothetical protein LR48_Vigan05g103700 [Vigna angularis]
MDCISRVTDFVQMKGDFYPDLVEVFYTKLRVLNRVIHSRVINMHTYCHMKYLSARTVIGWFFRDELTVGSTPTPIVDHTTFIPQTDFEKYVVDQFRKKSERDERVEDTLFRWEKKGNKNGIGFETEDSDDESTDED